MLVEESPRRDSGTYAALRGVYWVLATTIGGVVVGALEGGPLQFLATLVLEGFLIGAAQMVVLRVLLPNTWPRWLLVTGLGTILVNAVRTHPALHPVLLDVSTALWQRYGLWEVFWLNLVTQAVTAAMVGLVQWPLLKHLPLSILWVPISLLSGALRGVVGAATCLMACEQVANAAGSIGATALATGAGWAAYAAITSVPVIWWAAAHVRRS